MQFGVFCRFCGGASRGEGHALQEGLDDARERALRAIVRPGRPGRRWMRRMHWPQVPC